MRFLKISLSHNWNCLLDPIFARKPATPLRQAFLFPEKEAKKLFITAFVEALEKTDQENRRAVARISRAIWQVMDWDGKVASLDLESLTLEDLEAAFWEVYFCPALEEDPEEEKIEFNVLAHSLQVFDLQEKIKHLPRICRREAYI